MVDHPKKNLHIMVSEETRTELDTFFPDWGMKTIILRNLVEAFCRAYRQNQHLNVFKIIEKLEQ